MSYIPFWFIVLELGCAKDKDLELETRCIESEVVWETNSIQNEILQNISGEWVVTLIRSPDFEYIPDPGEIVATIPDVDSSNFIGLKSAGEDYACHTDAYIEVEYELIGFDDALTTFSGNIFAASTTVLGGYIYIPGVNYSRFEYYPTGEVWLSIGIGLVNEQCFTLPSKTELCPEYYVFEFSKF